MPDRKKLVQARAVLSGMQLRPAARKPEIEYTLRLAGVIALAAVSGCMPDDNGATSLATVALGSDVVRLAQYNVQFLLPEATPGHVFDAVDHFPDSAARASLIGQAMACMDIVSFNETSNNARREDIFAAMEASAAACDRPPLVDGRTRFFDFAHGPDNSQTSPVLDDEIAIASRFPIIEVNSTIYEDCSDIDCLADKGVLHVRVWRGPGHPAKDAMDVFTTHLNNGDEATLNKQLDHLAHFIEVHNDPDTPVVVMGDFNISDREGENSNPLYNIMFAKLDAVIPGPIEDIGLGAGPTNPGKDRRIDYIFVGGAPEPATGVQTNYFEGQFFDFDDEDLPQDGRLSDHGAVLGDILWEEPVLPPNPDIALPREVRVVVSRIQEITPDVPDVIPVPILVPIPTPIGIVTVPVPVMVGCDGLTDNFGNLKLAGGGNEVRKDFDEDHYIEGDDFTPQPPWAATLTFAAGATHGAVTFELFDEDDFFCGGSNDDQDINPFSDDFGIGLGVDFSTNGVFFGTTRLAALGEPIVLQGTDEDDRARVTLIIESRYSSTADSDGDGLTDAAEAYEHHTDPQDADSDDDGLTDGDEVLVHHTNPLDPDSDDDGLTDGDEVLIHHTNPLDSDSDDDGLTDGDEVLVHHTNPLDSDSDDDGLTDGDEVLVHHTNPLDPDSDDDGLTDGDEVLVYGTDPLDPDSDDDGLTDGAEVLVHGTDPLDPDSDDDELLDGIEVDTSTNPLDPDTDDDGLMDGEDVEFIENIINGLPGSAFRSEGNRNALVSRLEAIEHHVEHGHRSSAIHSLGLLRTRADGCGSAADRDDWIMDCAAQVQVRDLVDLLAMNLQS
jgi:hypothetical protein